MTRLCALLAVLANLACQDVQTKPITFQVTDSTACQLACEEITLQCIHSARATLTPMGGSSIPGPCVTTPSPASPPTLCTPGKLFPGPMFDRVDEQVASFQIEGFRNGIGTPGCQPQDLVFSAGTPMAFDLAAAAASGRPVAMTATCTMNRCEQLLNLMGEVLSWPPTGQPPQVDMPHYDILFGYSSVTGNPDSSFVTLFSIQYNPITNAVSGKGVYTTEARSDAARCVGFLTTLIPAGSTVSTLRCLDKSRLSGSIQMLNAFFVTPSIAAKVVQQLRIDDGVLLGQVRHNATGAGGAVVSVQTLVDGMDASARLYYLDDSNNFVPAVGHATSSSGVFAISGLSGKNLLSVTAHYMGTDAALQTRLIIPRTAAVFEIDL
ncbi:MAG TPA: hypothetical protein VKN99_02955 [Polyangia bacterium]|nr:hypothetical protein [Polyangia bacterium]